MAGGLVLLRLTAAAGELGFAFAPPVTPEAITIDTARVLLGAAGFWLVYRGVR